MLEFVNVTCYALRSVSRYNGSSAREGRLVSRLACLHNFGGAYAST